VLASIDGIRKNAAAVEKSVSKIKKLFDRTSAKLAAQHNKVLEKRVAAKLKELRNKVVGTIDPAKFFKGNVLDVILKVVSLIFIVGLVQLVINHNTRSTHVTYQDALEAVKAELEEEATRNLENEFTLKAKHEGERARKIFTSERDALNKLEKEQKLAKLAQRRALRENRLRAFEIKSIPQRLQEAQNAGSAHRTLKELNRNKPQDPTQRFNLLDVVEDMKAQKNGENSLIGDVDFAKKGAKSVGKEAAEKAPKKIAEGKAKREAKELKAKIAAHEAAFQAEVDAAAQITDLDEQKKVLARLNAEKRNAVEKGSTVGLERTDLVDLLNSRFRYRVVCS